MVKEINIVMKIIGILGVIFCIVSLLTPWSSSAFTFGVFKLNYSSPFYYDFVTNPSIHESSFFTMALFFSIIMIIIFIFTITALLMSIICITRIKEEISSSFLTISSLLIINVILYITITSLWTNNSSYVGSSYGSGFIAAIVAFVIFFILFIIKSVFQEKAREIQKIKKENELIDILKMRYVNGEITKEQFEQIKKDIGR